ELGHLVLVHGGEPCTCGRNGCWEAYASVTALVRQTKQAMEQHPHSMMHRISPHRVSGRTAFEAAKKGDKVAQEVVATYQEYIAEGLADLINIFSPEIVVVGGGISKEGDYLLDPVREKVQSRIFGSEVLPKRTIVAAQLGNDAGVIGAALLHA
ncbi:MAG: ROK family protein, partial [Clostridia bacterium]|nr:ROK family protein [Clostridia bacterium]